MPTDSDYVIFVALLLAVLGAGLLRVGLMNLDPPENARRGRLAPRYKKEPQAGYAAWGRSLSPH